MSVPLSVDQSLKDPEHSYLQQEVYANNGMPWLGKMNFKVYHSIHSKFVFCRFVGCSTMEKEAESLERKEWAQLHK